MDNDLNRDWPGRAEVLRAFGGDGDDYIVDQIDDNHTCPETWHDELDPNDRTYRCTRETGHTGRHHNTHARITWGTHHDWFGDAA